VSNPADIFKKVGDIHNVLKRFAPTPKDTKDFNGECRSLLRLFHRNEKFDNFTQYHPGTWREVCRAEGAHKYIRFIEIQNKLGLRAADQGKSEKWFIFKQTMFCRMAAHLSTCNVL
jgi:hypothetical protein